MKSFIEVKDIKKTVSKKITVRGEEKETQIYAELGMADIVAQWLIEVSSGRQNKYVVCKNWDATSGKDFENRGINDLKPDAQDFVFTMVQLIAATKDNAVVPSRDEDENTLAKDYNIPCDSNLYNVIVYSHRVGLTSLLAEKDKFVVSTSEVFKVDKSRILSPSGVNAFIKEHGTSGDLMKTNAYVGLGAKVLTDLAGFFTNKKFSDFEATLSSSADVANETCQILKISGTMFAGMGREQETLSNEVLIRWLAKPYEKTPGQE